MSIAAHLSTAFLALQFAGSGLLGAVAQTNAAGPSTNIPPSQRADTGLIVPTGWRAERVADGNLVESPAALAFDEHGRLFVAELREGRGARPGSTPGGRIRLLQDTDQDGVFDTSVVFADRLDHPTAISCSRGGLLVAGPRDLSFLLDQDGDEIADLRRTLLTFRPGSAPEDPRSFPRAMTWGPDGRFHLGFPAAEIEVLNPNAPGQGPLKFGSGGFSLDPRTLQLHAESGENVSGHAFDPAGRRWFTTSSALAITMLEAGLAGRNPYAPEMPAFVALMSIPRASIRLECLIQQSTAFSTNVHDEAILADPEAHAIYRVPLRAGEPHAVGIALDGQGLTPWVTARDASFRPMQVIAGPADSLYIADLERTDDPGSPSAGPDLDVSAPKPLGRIWRLSPVTTRSPARQGVDGSSSLGLLTALNDSNAWVRATAGRLLLEQRLTNAVPELRKMLTRAQWPVARLEALRALDAAGVATVQDLQQAMGDRDARVRATAAGMTASRVRNGRMPDPLWSSLRTLARDTSAPVRWQTALALGAIRTPAPQRLLTDLYLKDSADVWMRRALLTVDPETMAPLFMTLLGESAARQSPIGQELLRNLATSIGLGGAGSEVTDCLDALRNLSVPVELTFPIVNALAEGLEGRGRRLPDVDASGRWGSIANAAQNVMVGTADARIRAEAVKVVGACVSPSLRADEPLLLLFTPQLPVPMRIPMIQALSRQGFGRDFEALTQRWHLWDPPEQRATLDALLESLPGANALLSAVANQTIPIEALTSSHIRLLRDHPAEEVRTRAIRLLGPAQPSRDELVTIFMEALELPGSAKRGRELFSARCVDCHGSTKALFAPTPDQLGRLSSLQLMAGLIDPSRDVKLGHRTMLLRFPDGRLAWGVGRALNPAVIQLTTPTGTRRYWRGALASVEQTGWSLMPDNTAAGLTRQDVADLLQFIRTRASE
ncbi:MAG: hypothetical protein MUE94_12440 [Verrucomicrobia bacterium]|nr:hypothetical protein [Verrucomicrobiota bacterium]